MKISFLLLSISAILLLSACQTPPEAMVQVNSGVCTGEECELTPEQAALLEELTSAPVESINSDENLYIDYTSDLYTSMLGQEPFALFFHASWCPTCLFMEQDILSNSDKFPEGSRILKADFDIETDLKKEYKVYSQSIIVMINADGTVAETLIAPSAESLAESFTKLLK